MSEQHRIAGKRILVVEDDPGARASLNLLLKIERHAVVEASNGREALDLFLNDSFDLVIVDYAMPEMRGSELAQHIKQIAPSQPVLMITAYSEKFVGGNLPVDGLLGKPYGIEELRQAVASLLC